MYHYSWFFMIPGVHDGDPLAAVHEAMPEATVSSGELLNFHAVPASWTVFLICAVLALLARAGLNKARAKGGIDQYVPDAGLGARNTMELLIDAILNFADNTIGDRKIAIRFFPVFGALFLYILLSNLMGLVPGFLPPTSSVSNNFAMSAVVWLVFTYAGFKETGFGFLKHMAGPVAILAPAIFALEFFSTFIVRPITLSWRLYINMFADHLLLGVSSDILPVVLPSAFVGLGTFVSVVQAFVFMLLTVVYVALSVAHDDDHH